MLIVTGSDNNYAAGVMVLIASAHQYNPTARFAVLDMGISAENRARIDAMAERLGIELTRYEIDESTFAALTTKRSHLTKSTYLRLLIPTLLPTESRAIYMDCDMVVIGSLEELERIPLGDAYIAAVPCPSVGPVELAETNHVRGSYVNAGLLVMNLTQWRNENVSEQCFTLLTNPQRSLSFEDQSAINIIAKDRMVWLKKRYNNNASGDDLVDDAVVLHYFSHHKPWRNRAFLDYLWHEHAVPIQDLLPPRMPLPWRRRISELNNKRRAWMGLLFRSPKHVKRKALEKISEARFRAYRAALPQDKP